MAKPKFSLNPNPVFKAPVLIPVAGGKSVNIEFTFKHRTRDEFKKFSETTADREDVDLLQDVAEAWDLDEPFNKVNLELLTQNYMGSARAVVEVYIDELTSARAKN
jgi:hypothetical protein